MTPLCDYDCHQTYYVVMIVIQHNTTQPTIHFLKLLDKIESMTEHEASDDDDNDGGGNDSHGKEGGGGDDSSQPTGGGGGRRRRRRGEEPKSVEGSLSLVQKEEGLVKQQGVCRYSMSLLVEEVKEEMAKVMALIGSLPPLPPGTSMMKKQQVSE